MNTYKVSFLIPFFAWLAFADPIDDLQPGHWYEIPNSAQSQVWPAPNQFPTVNPGWEECGMDCWCGGAFDTKRNRIIFSGGGHGSYWGNEVYVFDLDDLKWYRLNDPTTQLDGNTGGACPIENNKYPCAIHSYDAVDYIPPPVDRYAYMDWNGKPLFLFDQDNLAWEPKSAPPTYGTDERTGAVMAFDPVSSLLFYHECFTSQLMAFNPTAGTWKAYGASAYLDYYYTASIDPKRRKFVAIGGSTWPNWGGRASVVWDITNPAAASIPGAALATTGDKAMESVANPGFEYDPVSDRFVAWGGGADVYTLNMDTKAWTKVSPAPTNTVTPTAKNMNGTYGRFRYVPSKNVFVLVNRGSDNVFVYRLTAPTTGVSTASKNTGLSLRGFPNPVAGRPLVKISAGLSGRRGAFAAAVYSPQGRLITRLSAGADGGLRWDTRGLPAGIYLIKLAGAGQNVTEKIVLAGK